MKRLFAILAVLVVFVLSGCYNSATSAGLFKVDNAKHGVKTGMPVGFPTVPQPDMTYHSSAPVYREIKLQTEEQRGLVLARNGADERLPLAETGVATDVEHACERKVISIKVERAGESPLCRDLYLHRTGGANVWRDFVERIYEPVIVSDQPLVERIAYEGGGDERAPGQLFSKGKAELWILRRRASDTHSRPLSEEVTIVRLRGKHVAPADLIRLAPQMAAHDARSGPGHHDDPQPVLDRRCRIAVSLHLGALLTFAKWGGFFSGVL